MNLQYVNKVSHKNVQAFVTIAESGSFAEAANKLYVSQPALSASIKHLEDVLGGQLFNRSTRRLALSPEGEVFYPRAKRILTNMEHALEDMTNLFGLQTGTLAIAAMPVFAEGYLAKLVATYKQEVPNIRIKVADLVMEKSIQLLRDGDVEMAFVFEPVTSPDLVFKPLFDDRFVAICSAQHALSQSNSLSLEQVSAFAMVMMNKGSAVRQWVESCLNIHQLNPAQFVETYQLGTLGALVSEGVGVSIVPALCTQDMLAKGCVVKPLAGEGIVKRVGILTKKHHRLSSAAQHFYELATTSSWAQIIR